MRLSNFLVTFSACALFAACANDEMPGGNNLPQGNGEQAFIAVRLAAPNAMTRAFQDGEPEENAVTKAHFYFFNNEGEAVTVDGTDNCIDNKSVSFNTESSDENVEETGNLLVLENVDIELPTKMVVVLNPPSGLTTGSKSLSDLQAAMDCSSTSSFVMSNSIYLNGSNQEVNAVDITANIAETSTAAEANPAVVHVERVLARVDVKNNNNALSNYSDDTDIKASEINGQTTPTTDKVIAVVKGWGLANTNKTSYLLKKLGSGWATTAPFTGWNDAANHRSYWAETTGLNSSVNENPNYKDMETAAQTEMPVTQYCQERTGITDAKNGNPTELLVIAELQVDNQAVTIARYAGQYYTVDALLDQFLTMTGDIYIKATDGSGTPNDWTKLDKSYLKLRPRTTSESESSVAAYEAVLDLKDSYTTGYSFASDDQGSGIMQLTDVEAKLNAFTAQLWYEGRTYYHVPITHDLDGKAADDPGRFGVVRNHLYNIAISGITGLGTPIPGDTNGDEDDPDDSEDPGKDPIDPEDPEDNNSYLAAEINILSWNVIDQNVELGKD